MTRRAEDLWRTWTHRPRVRSVARLPARAPRPGMPRGRRGTNTNRLAHAAPRRRAQEQTHSPASTVRTQPAQGLARTLEVHHPTRGQTDQQPGRTGAPRPGDVRSAAVPMRLSSSRLHLRNRPRAGAASAPARSRRLSCSGTPVASAFIAMGASGSLADFRGSTGEGPPPTPRQALAHRGQQRCSRWGSTPLRHSPQATGEGDPRSCGHTRLTGPRNPRSTRYLAAQHRKKGWLLQEVVKWRDRDLNPGHHDFQSCALPAELSRPWPRDASGWIAFRDRRRA